MYTWIQYGYALYPTHPCGVSFNRLKMRSPSVRNLRVFLAAELDLLPEEDVKRYYRQRQRPRRTGKGA